MHGLHATGGRLVTTDGRLVQCQAAHPALPSLDPAIPPTPAPQGTYVHNAGTCIIHDSNGSNRKLRFKSATKSTCPTGCPVAENGQSGQPMFSADGAGWLVHGVLSWGPPVSATGCTNGAGGRGRAPAGGAWGFEGKGGAAG